MLPNQAGNLGALFGAAETCAEELRGLLDRCEDERRLSGTDRRRGPIQKL
jgi:hypothetical protein